MGDYKLKTADDYVVPDHLRMNVEKAIMKLLVLKELVSRLTVLSRRLTVVSGRLNVVF